MSTYAQNEEKIEITQEELDQLAKSEAEMASWFEDLKTPGVRVEGSNMYFSEEAQKLIKDEVYRGETYKDAYTFLDVRESLQKYEIQKAYYRMLTLYPEHKEEVITYIYSYDKVFPTDEVLVSAFYTYAFFDPEITELTDGKPNILRPDTFEEYLRRAREIVSYIHYFRNEEKKGKS
ncbi:MAG: hypothetical protein AAFP76_12655 [Bacteroidota bacterium]